VSAITERGLDGAVRALREAGERIQDGIRQTMRQGTTIVALEAKRLSPYDTGRLMSSITSEVRGISMDVVGIVGSNVEYAPYQELGTKWMRGRRYLQGAFEKKKREVIDLFVELARQIQV